MAHLIGEDPQAIFRFNTLKAEVFEYWGRENEEIGYPIYSLLLIRMMNASPTKHVALRVENFEDKTRVTASWMTIDTNHLPADSEAVNVFYAILDEATINLITANRNFPIINARFGRHSNGNQFYVFFNKSSIKAKGGGSGAEVDGSGAVVR